MWQSMGFALQFGLGAVLSPVQQLYVILPLFVAAYGGLWACNSFVQRFDAPAAVGGGTVRKSLWGKGGRGSDDDTSDDQGPLLAAAEDSY